MHFSNIGYSVLFDQSENSVKSTNRLHS